MTLEQLIQALRDEVGVARRRALEARLARLVGELALPVARAVLRAHASEVDDVVLEATQNVLAALSRGVVVTNHEAWVKRVARNAAITALDKARRVPGVGDGHGEGEVEHLPASSGDPEAMAIQAQQVLRLRGALAKLPPRYRHLIVAIAIEGRDHGEVLDDLMARGEAAPGGSRETLINTHIDVPLRRARARLARILEQLDKGEAS